uniref:Putative secreted protein n=1 Tax=Anopheles darlingi TaxID=43151 RepID=A0A2M4D4Y1_ANODA
MRSRTNLHRHSVLLSLSLSLEPTMTTTTTTSHAAVAVAPRQDTRHNNKRCRITIGISSRHRERHYTPPGTCQRTLQPADEAHRERASGEHRER